ncbi:MAG: class I SAM-dependent methyltransferase [Synechococcaceae cyanobacterium]|nr:class I SAM-dependent methyltransferase [Synechococcaceae cyanobacterium]
MSVQPEAEFFNGVPAGASSRSDGDDRVPFDGVPAESIGTAEAADRGYDTLIPRLIPGYASLARLAVALLAASPLASTPGSAVLVAGCGTGAELLEARRQRPDWLLTGLDPSAAMLAIARQRLGEDGSIRWQGCRVEQLAGEAQFDGALAVLVLHSLPDDGSKLGFLSALARQLRPGAQLLLVDLMQPERSPLQEQVARAWAGFQQASGLSPGSVEALQALGRETHPIGTARLTALLDAAGFGDPALIFQALDFAGHLVQRRR